MGGVGEGHMCAPSVGKKLTLGIIPQEPPTLALFVFLFLETGSLTVTGVLPIRLGWPAREPHLVLHPQFID